MFAKKLPLWEATFLKWQIWHWYDFHDCSSNLFIVDFERYLPTVNYFGSPKELKYAFYESKAYFRRRAEASCAEIISARLGSAWHASVLDEENIVVLKQFYWWYLIKDDFKVKENINNNLSN